MRFGFSLSPWEWAGVRALGGANTPAEARPRHD